uniref:Plant heme peroxidase family profile domain-containing protein n=2 Tax=Pseudo-nitzschia australis TaxID=44445 RepID=A0A7S4AAC2_9STRA
MKMINIASLLPLLFLLAINIVFVRLVESASVEVTNDCFVVGDKINVKFANVDGEGIFVGIYADADVPDKTVLPALESEDILKHWVLTCGEHENCDTWPERGVVQLPTDKLEGDYFIAVSGNRSGLTPQATTRVFHVGHCSTFFNIPNKFPTSRPITLGPVASASATSAPTPRPVPIPSPVQVVGGSVQVVSDAINSVLGDARIQIEDLIRNDGDLTGKFLRLVFHDCIGGCNGCVDMANPDNAGLDKPVNVLEPIANSFLDRGLTRTDIWMLAGLVAIETAVPSEHRDILFDLHWIGRRTCEEMIDCGVDFGGNPTVCTAMRGPHVGQAHATAGTKSIQTFFENEFNFNPQQVTALMGAHSVGKMSRENSGFSGRWDLSEATFDGGYWIELVGEPPDFSLEDVINDDLPGIPNRRQWRGVINEDSRVTMLHTDIALVRNLEDMRDGQANCDFKGPNECSHDTPFRPHAQRYTQDNRAWVLDFRDVFNILIDHGHEKAGDCSPERICTFGFESQNTLATESKTAPTPPSSPVIEQGISGATISLDKPCYNSGETIVVNYNNISGENVWIGILLLNTVSDFKDLPVGPDSQSELLKDWTRSCGHRVCHTWQSQGGFQFPTNELEEDEYIVVVSGDGGSLEGQASTTFALGEC